MNGILTLSWSNVKSALVYGALTLGATLLLSVAQSILDARTIFGLDWKHIVDSAIIATLPVLIIAISVVKNLLTTTKGNFVGVVEVVPEKGEK